MDGIFGSDDSREASSAGSRSASPASSEGSRSPAQHSDDGEQSEHSDAEERSEKSYHSSPPRSPASGDESGYEDKGEEASGDERRDSGDEGSDESRHVDDQSGDEETSARTPARSERSDSDAESAIGRKRRRSGGSEAASAGSAAEDLDDLSSDEEGAAKKKGGGETPVKRMGSDEEEEPEEKRAEPEQGEEEEVPVPETRIDVEIPRIMTNLGNEVHFVKLPNFLSVDTRPYDPQWYEDEVDEDEVLDEEGRARLKLKVENTVRWRYLYDKMGNPVRQSNARIIKWSDGRRVMSLHLGSEIFDVHKQSLMQGDHNHLFIRQGTGLQGQAVFRTKLSFRQVTNCSRPHSTDSFTHRKMTLSLAGRSQKTQKIRVLPQVGQDPEAHRSEMIKKEEDRLRASIRRESKQRRLREKSHSRGLSAAYLEADEDDAAISLSAIKSKYRRGGAALKERPSIYSSEEDASDLEEQRARRLEKAKAGPENDDDDSDLDYFDKKAESKKAKKAIEESDEDD
ncbi:hypothetical protein HPB51_000921 [Rhipicephalus microplus]|uniref:RNA polymerase-associated protein LEO1 n=1 Tax=Rhipicephalus microplus TaxID=6941 RepID=A0A9J6DK90_RHIMP|nr:hypothetical protein HPB51_000921 [Rhipicephalus microplus]